MAERTCLKCGWVAFAVSREHAEREIIRFNAYLDRLSEDDKIEVYGNQRASLETYESCFHCKGSYKNFRPAREGDAPDGCTLQPIIDPGL